MENDNEFKGFSNNAKRVFNAQKTGNSKIGLAHFTAMDNLYNEENNSEGYISFGIAENVLSYELLKEKLETIPMSQKLTQYSAFGGLEECRKAVANLLQNHIFTYRPENKDLLVKNNQILLTDGCTPLLENVFNMFCNEDEVCIIPSPFYPAFVSDSYHRFGVRVLPAKTEVYDEQTKQVISFQLDIEEFEKIYSTQKVKMVLVCNPNNPNGFIFPQDQVERLVEWCRSKQIHYVSDEIYALSVFDKPQPNISGGSSGSSDGEDIKTNEFKSVYDVCKGDMGEFVHIVSGFSKDFCLNGFRAGYFYSQNKNAYNYLTSTSNFYICSNLVQAALINILSDDEYLAHYIRENQNNLKRAYEFTVNTLKEFNIPFIKSSSGVFLTLDLRKILPAFPLNQNDPFSQELLVWEEIFNAKVIINPGKFCYFSEPGFYRFIFTVPNGFIYEGIKRISKVYHRILTSLNNNNK
ncbi:hypothetical protein DICPUDRAFT_152148 [Dictyostelium purpureum]|uniref:Aminotransferase class I/classII large domain-containing protein n=1 Tax=Dictyostelium purpureum TaxID=5786 RepID=F0ZKL0_DICPU|nr:uncharacterized protein DICPUDRAFT_152148 [Dictyostelium purpureum]EGC35531.1 hypothetical protein DICPUDRAFT_152148 [Dictyostelium purpureum]|eukprot:XP_003287957.1 hypothetical protein DICPUDRAFT_152148 [Dictyostelium purpureum]